MSRFRGMSVFCHGANPLGQCTKTRGKRADVCGHLQVALMRESGLTSWVISLLPARNVLFSADDCFKHSIKKSPRHGTEALKDGLKCLWLNRSAFAVWWRCLFWLVYPFLSWSQLWSTTGLFYQSIRKLNFLADLVTQMLFYNHRFYSRKSLHYCGFSFMFITLSPLLRGLNEIT